MKRSKTLKEQDRNTFLFLIFWCCLSMYILESMSEHLGYFESSIFSLILLIAGSLNYFFKRKRMFAQRKIKLLSHNVCLPKSVELALIKLHFGNTDFALIELKSALTEHPKNQTIKEIIEIAETYYN